jgi:hypothetical protein
MYQGGSAYGERLLFQIVWMSTDKWGEPHTCCGMDSTKASEICVFAA